MKRKLYLEGELATKFGREFSVSAKTVQEAIKILDVNFKDFKQYLLDLHNKGVGFTVEVAGNGISQEQLFDQINEGDIVITPIPAGSKSKGAQIITGILLIVASFFIPGAGGPMALFAEGGVTFANAVAFTAFTVGVNLSMSGIQQLMAPDPGTDIQEPQSYLFDGSQQNIVEGDPVPVLYGELRVPGRPIGFGVVVSGNRFTSSVNTEDASSSDTTTQTDEQGNLNTVPVDTGSTTVPEPSIVSVTPDVSYIVQGDTITYTVVTENIDDNTFLDYRIIGLAGNPYVDQTELAGKVEIIGNTGEFSATIAATSTYVINTIENLSIRAYVSSSTLSIQAKTSSATLGASVTISGPDQITQTGGPYTYTITAVGLPDTTLLWRLLGGTGFVEDTDNTDTWEGYAPGGLFPLTNGSGSIEVVTLENQVIDGPHNMMLSIDIPGFSANASNLLGSKIIYLVDDSLPNDVTPGTDTTDDVIDTTPDDTFNPNPRPVPTSEQ